MGALLAEIENLKKRLDTARVNEDSAAIKRITLDRENFITDAKHKWKDLQKGLNVLSFIRNILATKSWHQALSTIENKEQQSESEGAKTDVQKFTLNAHKAQESAQELLTKYQNAGIELAPLTFLQKVTSKVSM